VPLPTLLAVASRLMGGYWWRTAQAVGVSPPGLGVLRILAARAGLRPSEVAAIGRWTPGTVTSLTDTLVRDGYVERRRDDRDRRVVRLHLTESGQDKANEAMKIIAPQWNKAFDFIGSGDEPVIRKFLVDTIGRFGELARERDGVSPERKPGD
jgi:DNA-binding MarR family transcriptional regulator